MCRLSPSFLSNRYLSTRHFRHRRQGCPATLPGIFLHETLWCHKRTLLWLVHRKGKVCCQFFASREPICLESTLTDIAVDRLKIATLDRVMCAKTSCVDNLNHDILGIGSQFAECCDGTKRSVAEMLMNEIVVISTQVRSSKCRLLSRVDGKSCSTPTVLKPCKSPGSGSFR